MATHIQNAKITSPFKGADDPQVSYGVTYSATRTSNTKVKYTFTIQAFLNSGGWLGTGHVFNCTIGVGGVTGTVNLRKWGDVWQNSSDAYATKELTIECTSTQAENQTVSFEVKRGNDGEKNDSYDTNDKIDSLGEVSTSDYYVTSPELLVTECKAPTSITITPSVFDDKVTISWSGAIPGTGNPIDQYRIRYGVSDTPLGNNEYTYNELATTSDTSITIGMSDKVKDRQYVKIAVRTEGKAGDSYHSNFAYADVVQRKCRNTKIKKGNEWVNCETFVKQNGVWVESVVDILNN